MTNDLQEDGRPPLRQAVGPVLGVYDTDEQILLLSAVTLGIFWAIQKAEYPHVNPAVASLLVVGVFSAWALLRRVRFAPEAALIYAALVGVADRLSRKPVIDSDVMAATQEAVHTLLHGQNPYTHFYVSTRPPGVGFIYLPGEIIFYMIPNAIFGHIAGTDRWAAIAIIFLLAALAPCVGLAPAALATALYATFGSASFFALDGSNDTSLGFLVVLAVVLLVWSERPGYESRLLLYASAIVFGWALVYKQLAWFIYPFVVAYLRRRGADWRAYVGISVGLAVLILFPFFLIAPSALLRSLVSTVSFHQDVWGLNGWSALYRFAPGLIHRLVPLLPFVLLASVAVAGLAMLVRPAANLGLALLQGLGLLFVALFLARWTISPYYTFASAVLAAAVSLLRLSGPGWRDDG